MISPSATRAPSSLCTGSRPRAITCAFSDCRLGETLRPFCRCSMTNTIPPIISSKPFPPNGNERFSDLSFREWGFLDGAQNKIFGGSSDGNSSTPSSSTLPSSTLSSSTPAQPAYNPVSTPANQPTPMPDNSSTGNPSNGGNGGNSPAPSPSSSSSVSQPPSSPPPAQNNASPPPSNNNPVNVPPS